MHHDLAHVTVSQRSREDENGIMGHGVTTLSSSH